MQDIKRVFGILSHLGDYPETFPSHARATSEGLVRTLRAILGRKAIVLTPQTFAGCPPVTTVEGGKQIAKVIADKLHGSVQQLKEPVVMIFDAHAGQASHAFHPLLCA